jgi:hypothetical protein
MEKYTLDTNCLIAIARAEPAANHIRALAVAHRAERIDLAIPAISASERQPGGGYLQHSGATVLPAAPFRGM